MEPELMINNSSKYGSSISQRKDNFVLNREKLLKFEVEGPEFAKFLRSLEQFIQTVKGQKHAGKVRNVCCTFVSFKT